jgi:hypothetical protein
MIILYHLPLFSDNFFQTYFTEQALRIDFYQAGNKDQETIIIDELYLENHWAGNPSNLIDTLNLGHYLFNVYSTRTNQLIYSYGFGTLFMEWQTTSEAYAGSNKVMGGSIRMPFPRDSVEIRFFNRDSLNTFSQLIDQFIVDPSSNNINRENRANGIKIISIQQSGPIDKMIDLAILGEGYTPEESETFEDDVNSATEILFSVEPFKSYRNRFNIYGLLRTSKESGVDDPSSELYVNTAMNFTFNTFGSDRYLMSTDYISINDITSAVPSDVILIIINTEKYGGGGIYNLYSSTAIHNTYTKNIILHEMGHSFGGLGDEYYTSDIAYHDFYPTHLEPWEPNLTILSDLKKLKWNHLLSRGISIPTSWSQEKYDAGADRYLKLLNEYNQSIDDADKKKKLRLEYQDSVRLFFERHKQKNKIGAFEGGGYKAKGIYRPALDCIMFSNRIQEYDLVCQKAIEKRIIFLTQ